MMMLLLASRGCVAQAWSVIETLQGWRMFEDPTGPRASSVLRERKIAAMNGIRILSRRVPIKRCTRAPWTLMARGGLLCPVSGKE